MVWNVMQIREERIPKKMLHTKMKRKQLRERSRTRRMDYIRKDIELEGKIGEK